MALAWVRDCTAVSLASLGTPISTTLSFGSAINAGETIIVFIAQTASGTRVYSVSDSIDGDYQLLHSTNPFYYAAIFWLPVSSGGTPTITVHHNQNSVNFYCGASVFSGFGSTPGKDASDAYAESVDVTSPTPHVCSADGITSAHELIAVCSGLTNSTVTSTGPGTGYTQITDGVTGNDRILFQWQRFAGGCSAEKGEWLSVGTARKGTSVIALISATAAPSSSKIPGIANLRRRLAS